jgi:glycerophosphoryl diester phosphodiesterase
MAILLGHRGSPHQAPENTMESFRLAIAAGAAGFEFDVRRSSDGRLVIIHDPRVRRLSVTRHSASVLGLPLLEEVLRTFHGAFLDIEMKVPGIERRVIDLAHRHLDVHRFVITSFQGRSVREVKRLSPTTPAGWLFKRTLLTLPRWAAAPQLDYLCPHHSVLTRRLVRLARARGLRLVTWTVNRPATMRRVLALGADVVITNYPDRYATSF